MSYAVALNLVRSAWSICCIAIVVFFALFLSRSKDPWQIIFEIETGAVLFAAVTWGGVALRHKVEGHYQRHTRDAERMLSSLGRALSGIHDVRTILQVSIRELVEAFHAQPITVLVDKGAQLELVAESGAREPRPIRLERTSPVLRHLLLSQGPVKVDFQDPQSWVCGLPPQDSEALSELEARVLVPLATERRMVGVMGVGPKRWDMPYERVDMQFLTAAASQIVLALENSRLNDDIRAELAERAKLNRELEIAREVQQRLFPQNLPKITGLEFAGYCRPALEVGGDYYDFIRLDAGGLGIAIGDVSGKGIAAALMMASLQASLRGQTLSPSATLAGMIERINRLVFEASAVNRYATFFYAEFDPTTYLLHYVNAGHNAPLLLRVSEPPARLEEGGTVIGLFPDVVYQEGRCQLQSGDTLVAFTDGITEALNGSEMEFGEESLLDAIKASPGRTAADLITNVLEKVDLFTAGAPQHDDMTLITMRVQ